MLLRDVDTPNGGDMMSVAGALPATLAKRLLAAVVDGVAALILGGAFVLAGALPLLTAGAQQDVDPGTAPRNGVAMMLVGAVALLALGVVQWWLLASRGATVGKQLVGLRALSVQDGRPVGPTRALLRFAVPAVAWLVPVVGPAAVYLSPLLDTSGRRRGWHDLAAGTVVYDIAAGVDPTTAHRTTTDADVALRLEQIVRTAPRQAPTTASSPKPVPAPPIDEVPLVEEVPSSPAGATSSPAPAEVPGLISSVPGRATPDPADTTRPMTTSRIVPRSGDVLTAAPFPGRHEDEDVEMTRLRPARSRVPEVTSVEPQVTIELSDGQRARFTGTALVGRNPEPRAGETAVRLIQVPDPGRSVSKTHLAIGVDRHGVWVKDRASTNGTVVTLPDGQQILCAPDQQVRLPRGASVAFGDYGLAVAELSLVAQEA